MNAPLHILLAAIGVVLVGLSVPLVLELLLLSLAAALPNEPERLPEDRAFPLAVIIPAHNERKLIQACVRSVIASGGPSVAVYVIAHNCSDDTAAQAEEAGAQALVLNDDGKHGKGAALLYGFAQALERGAGAVMVIDADSFVSSDLIPVCQARFRAGADALQCRYVVANSNDTERTRLLALSFLGINVLRPRGRQRLGLSCGIFGNGFALSAATLRAVPYVAHSVVEDLEYHLLLVNTGRRVVFVDDAEVFGEMPDNTAAASTQRARWEGGRARMRREFAPRLLTQVLSGKLRLIEPLLDLLTLPIATGVLTLLATFCVPLWWTHLYGAVGLLAILLYVLVSASLAPNPGQTLRALAGVPGHLFFKILLIPSTRRAARAKAEWQRTERNEK